ncbi:hypothetical protein INT45_001407 [Circinella minor]|uniref:Uncharacterized protein n=1 Tax=Circinella minor TaxID=1195481 RepID=A0A8H7VIQ8_9FUNG|nr:hypothetical protein INT45_001407 [Circinella minor]
MSNDRTQELTHNSVFAHDSNESVDDEQQYPLTEATGRQILQAIREMANILSNAQLHQEPEVSSGTTISNQNARNTSVRRCHKPRIMIEGTEYVISNVNNDHIDNALLTFFHVPEEDIESVRNDLTTHLMRVVRGFIEDRLRQHNLSSMTTKWINIPKSIKSRAIEIYESKTHEVLHLQLSSCEGSWIAQHCLHSGWNNFVGSERRSERESQTENGSTRFALSLSPSPLPQTRRPSTPPRLVMQETLSCSYQSQGNQDVFHGESASSISLTENQEPTVSNGRGRGRGTQRERGTRVRGRDIGRGTVSRARGRGRGRGRDQGRDVREDSINSNSTLNEEKQQEETQKLQQELKVRQDVQTKSIMMQHKAMA